MSAPHDDTPPNVDDDTVIDLRDPRPVPVADAAADRVESALPHVPPATASGRPDPLPEGCTTVVITGGDLWMQAEAFVYDCYRQVEFCEPSPRRRVEELARWHEASTFHAVIDSDGEIIGTIRTILGNFGELPIGRFTRTDFEDDDPVSELSSLAVRSDVRSTGVIERLYRMGWIAGCRAGATATVALIDDWLLDIFHQTYRLYFRVVGLPKHHMGGDPIPVSLPHGNVTYDPIRRENPAFWAWLLEGVTASEADAWGLPTTLPDGQVLLPGGDVAPIAR